MSVEDFHFVVSEIRPFTDYVYLHVLGEPLLHPQFEEILLLAKNAGLNVNISTNGSLLMKRKDYLLENPVRQINISLHDAEENIPKDKWEEYITTVLNISTEISSNSYINFRLWNQTNKTSFDFNSLCVRLICKRFHLPENTDLFHQKGRNITLATNMYLQLAPRFEWVEGKISSDKTCYGLRDQIAILSDGSVVPCCMDADANLLLGNIFTEKLSVILQSDKAQRIKKGFEQNKAVEPYCQKCGFRSS